MGGRESNKLEGCSVVRAQPARRKGLGLGLAEVSGPEEELSPVRSSRGPTFENFPWEPGMIPAPYLSLFLLKNIFD